MHFNRALAVVYFFLFTNLTFAEQVIQSPLKQNANGHLVVNSVTSREGADSFSLNVNLGIKDDPNAAKESYQERQRKFELDPVSVYDYVKVRPSVKFTINSSPSGIVLSGAFKPQTEYLVTLLKGLRINSGQELAADSESKVGTRSFRPHIRFSSKSRYVPGALAGSLSFESVNVKSVLISIRQVLPQNLHQWLTSSESANQYVSEEIKTRTISVKAKRNTVYKGTVSLEEFNPMGNGIYVITATAQNSNGPVTEGEEQSAEGDEGDDGGGYYGNTSDTSSLVVSNLSAVVKLGGRNTLKAWALKTGDLSPVEGISVELYSDSNRKLDSCVTEGAQAECSLKWKDAKSPPYAVVFKGKGDATYIRLSDLSIKNDRFHAGSRDFISDQQGFDAFVFSGRDLYRPGENADLAVQVRNKKFEAVAKLPLTWKITGPKGKIVREATTSTDEFGVSSLPFQTQLSFDTGKYQAQVWAAKQQLHSFSFLVEEFVPERIAVNVKPEREQYIDKTGAQFSVNANYLFGPPVVEGDFSASCSLVPAFKKIPKNHEYATGYYMDEMNKSIALDVVTGKTGKNGSAKFNCEYGNALGKKSPVIYELRAKTDVEEAGSSRVSSKTATTFVGSANSLIGLKVADKKSGEIKVSGGFFDFKGEPVKKQATLKARLYRIDQNWNYSYDYSGSSNWKVQELIVPAGVEKTITVNDSKFELALTPPQDWGQWLVRVEDSGTGLVSDLNTGYLGWYYDSSNNGPVVREPEDLKMEISKSKLSPGDSFKVIFQAPFAGRLLVALESNTVVESRWISVTKPGTIEAEFKAPAVLPNFYVTGLLIKNPQEGKRFLPARAFGAQNVEVIPGEHRMKIKVDAPEVMESRKELKISIHNDQKTAAEYSVAVIDEGILQMTGFKSPDPLSRFFEARRLGVVSSETIGWTMAGTAKTTPGGDEGKAKGPQNMPVRLVSFFEAKVKSDSSGQARVSFQIPEFQGKLRVMVVASGKTRLGSSATDVLVRDPVVIQSTLPRFLTRDDRFQFPVALTNTSGKDQKVTVSVEASREINVNNPVQSVELKNNQMKTLKYPVTVLSDSGLADIRILVKDAAGVLLSQESFALKVRPKGVEQSLHLTFQAQDNVDLQKAIPKDWNPNIKINAVLSNIPFLGQISQMEYLLRYPYGCIEQTTSTVLPLLAIDDLFKFAETQPKKLTSAKDYVNRGISRVLSMQTGNGGFGYWPGDGEAAPWGTAYATYMLIEAKKLGYEVSNEAIDSALEYMLNHVRNKNFSFANADYDVAAHPWMLYVLAKGGRQVTTEVRKSVEKFSAKSAKNHSDFQGENIFLLAAAAKSLGDNETLEKLLPNDDELSKQLAGPRDSYYTYWSALRSDGLRLSIIQDLWPKSAAIAVLSQRVANSLDRRGRHFNTQETAWGVLGLGKLAKSSDTVSAAELKKMELLADGKVVSGRFDVQGQPAWNLEGPLTSTVFTVQGAASDKRAFLYLNVSGVSSSIPKGKGEFSISRRYLDRSGNETNIQNVKQGDVLTVLLKFESGGATYTNTAIVDFVPAGFEIENSRLGRAEEVTWINKDRLFAPDYQDIRDDRIQLFGTVSSTEKEFYYSVRAVTPGKYIAPPPLIEQMYDPEAFQYGAATAVEILQP